MVNKLVEECNETIDEVKLTLAENENSYKHKFCILHIVLFLVFFYNQCCNWGLFCLL